MGPQCHPHSLAPHMFTRSNYTWIILGSGEGCLKPHQLPPILLCTLHEQQAQRTDK